MFPAHEANQNAGWNTLPFSICKIIQDVSQIDTNLSDQLKISVQVFCSTSLQNPYEKRYIYWKRNDNLYWEDRCCSGFHQSNCGAGTENFQRNRNKCLHLNSVRTCIYRTHAKKNFLVNLIFAARKCNI